MKKPFRYRASLFTAVAFFSLLGGQAIACLSPALTEMRDGQSMACCTQSCRFDPTPADARKACEQSRFAVNQRPAIVSPIATALPIMLKDLPGSFLGADDAPLAQRLTVDAQAPSEHHLSLQYGTKLYLLTHSLLI